MLTSAQTLQFFSSVKTLLKSLNKFQVSNTVINSSQLFLFLFQSCFNRCRRPSILNSLILRDCGLPAQNSKYARGKPKLRNLLHKKFQKIRSHYTSTVFNSFLYNQNNIQKNVSPIPVQLLPNTEQCNIFFYHQEPIVLETFSWILA